MRTRNFSVKLKKALIALLGVLFIIPLFSIYSVAVTNDPVIELPDEFGKGVINLIENVAQKSKEVGGFEGNTGEAGRFRGFLYVTISNSDYDDLKRGPLKSLGQNKISVAMLFYDKLDKKQKLEIMGFTLSAIRNSELTAQSKLFLYDFVANLDTVTSSKAKITDTDTRQDFYTAYKWFAPFGGTVGWILGCLTILLFSFLVLVMVIDFLYITIPYFRILVDKGANEKPRWVSKEAYNAVLDGERTDENRKNVIILYMKKRIFQIIIVCLCLVYLLMGQIYRLLAWIIDYLEMFFEKFV